MFATHWSTACVEQRQCSIQDCRAKGYTLRPVQITYRYLYTVMCYYYVYIWCINCECDTTYYNAKFTRHWQLEAGRIAAFQSEANTVL